MLLNMFKKRNFKKIISVRLNPEIQKDLIICTSVCLYISNIRCGVKLVLKRVLINPRLKPGVSKAMLYKGFSPQLYFISDTNEKKSLKNVSMAQSLKFIIKTKTIK